MTKLESFDFVLKKWSKNSIRHPSLKIVEIILVRSDAGTVVQYIEDNSLKSLSKRAHDLALAVSGDGNINQLGNGDN